MLAMIASAAVGGCQARSDTALHALVSWQGATVDQLEFSVVAARPGVPVVVAPALRPSAAGHTLASPEDVIILVRDDLDGTPVKCRVTALLQGALVQVAESAPVTVHRHAVVACTLPLPPGMADSHTPNGSACLDRRQCTSGYCADGVCCTSLCNGTCQACDLPASPGVCAFVSSGGAPHDPSQCSAADPTSCAGDGTCDGHGACRLYPAGTNCSVGRCGGSSIIGMRVCDGRGSCADGPVVSCAPFQCDGAASPARCLNTCASDADCVAGRPCVSGSCGPRPDAGPCTEDAQCQSGHCADGVCCASACQGPCLSCNQLGLAGTCTPVAAGSADPRGLCSDSRAGNPSSCGASGACDGAGKCALYAAETICTPPACNGSSLTKAATCDGGGTCQPGGTQSCNPYGCTGSHCNGTCAADADCAPGQSCDVTAMSCGLKGLGQACGGAGECASGFCTDGVCCSESCDGPCRSCALPSAPGVCKNIAAGAADPRATCRATDPSTCGTDGLCDGNGACRRYPAGSTCGAQTCNGSARMLPARCDAQGNCVSGAPLPCAPYTCNGNACFGSCSGDSDCVPPNVCLGGACGLRPSGAICVIDSDCSTGHCTDGVCCDSAACAPCRACNLASTRGHCAAVPALAPEPHGACLDQGSMSCGTDGTCDGAGNCHLYASSTSCGMPSCSGSTLTAAPACDGAGRCVAGGQQPCSPFLCGAGVCKTTCTGDGDCLAPNRCMGGSCGLKALGATCASGTECDSGACTNGVCCTSGACGSCRSCNVGGRAGTCQPVPPGAPDPAGVCATDPAASCGRTGSCDGAGACAVYAAGTVCADAVCSGNAVMAASTCDGSGRCVAGALGADCAPYLCNGGACSTGCETSAQCVPPATCSGAVCRRKALGAACTSGAECDSGACVDGACCSSPACGTCQSCNVPGFVGACASLPVGATDPHGGCTAAPASSCGLDGACDGAGACRRWSAGTPCQAATCSMRKKSQNPRTCDGAGTCADRGTANCAPNDCDTTTGLCP
jgi:hypothetical protein